MDVCIVHCTFCALSLRALEYQSHSFILSADGLQPLASEKEIVMRCENLSISKWSHKVAYSNQSQPSLVSCRSVVMALIK